VNAAAYRRNLRIDIPDDTLVDLRHRLRHARWPDEIAPGWKYGVDRAYLRSLVDYWLEEYDGASTKPP